MKLEEQSEEFWKRLSEGFRVVLGPDLKEELVSLGLSIICSNGYGWLRAPIEIINPDYLKKELTGWQLIFNRITSSTIDDLWENLKNEAMQYVAIADYQLKGRGTRGRKWISPPFGGGMFVSFNWPMENYTIGQTIGLRMALGIIQELKKWGVTDLAIKWPNDLLWQGKKLAGILVETNTSLPNQLIASLGLNFFLPAFYNGTINQPFTDLNEILLDKKIGHNLIIVKLLKSIWKYLVDPNILSEYQTYDFWFGKKIRLIWQKKVYEGEGLGIDEEGNFLLKTGDNVIKCRPLSVDFLR